MNCEILRSRWGQIILLEALVHFRPAGARCAGALSRPCCAVSAYGTQHSQHSQQCQHCPELDVGSADSVMSVTGRVLFRVPRIF